MQNKVTEEQNSKLIKAPSVEEINRTVRSLKNEKAPGSDGMTAEFVKEIWENAEQDVVDFILTFWSTGQLSWKQLTSVIKLIPKEGNRLKVTNWRPLQLLNIGYKIISKILPNRLGEIAGTIVDLEQKGFIKGRAISDNVLKFLISQEWAELSQEPTLFVKLEFFKAYDLVNHEYLWATMKAMGFHSKFITLTQGLVQGSVSKIHVNGQFSEEISIERGVKQGCPLAPLLFALSTQPLMNILKKRQGEGRLKGLSLCGQAQTLYNLFADDSGVLIRADPENFTALQEAIQLYKDISGAKLNMAKSTIIPIAMERSPDWLSRFECYVAREGKVIRYLGHPIGWNVKDTQKSDFILGKLQGRLGSWTYRMLSFSGRMVVMKHILKVMPNHLFTSLTINQKAADMLEAVCRKFVWGQSESGKDRIPLIAWKQVAKAKRDGGLAVTSFLIQSYPSKRCQQDPGGRERRGWTNAQILLTKCPKRVPKAQTVTGLLTVWNEARKHLRIDKEHLNLEGGETPILYVDILEEQEMISKDDGIQVRKALRAAKVTKIGSWADWAWERNTSRPLSEAEELTVDLGVSIEVQSGEIEELPWQWQVGNKSVSS
ncbi:hypothetical protein R1sor_008007 [Riccia sorocarpa]|uniref:Reverse transcriptase domain-containing protein n=1 Tax=Riccia sorocarpa TaxID=122646 RepID=A0ABD3HUA9_9MARC